MEYKEFLRERRGRMADIIRVAFRHLGGEADAPPLTPPWFLPGAETVWRRIVETERALRGIVREVSDLIDVTTLIYPTSTKPRFWKEMVGFARRARPPCGWVE